MQIQFAITGYKSSIGQIPASSAVMIINCRDLNSIIGRVLVNWLADELSRADAAYI